MRTIRTLALAAVLAGVSAAPLAAQGAQSVDVAMKDSLNGAMAVVSAEEIAARGDAMFFDGQIEEAREMYELAIVHARREGKLAAPIYWKLAHTHYAQEQTVRTAQVFDRLANAAHRFGNPVAKAHALLEASIIYQSDRQYRTAADRTRELQELLASPDFPEDERKKIESRIFPAKG